MRRGTDKTDRHTDTNKDRRAWPISTTHAKCKNPFDIDAWSWLRDEHVLSCSPGSPDDRRTRQVQWIHVEFASRLDCATYLPIWEDTGPYGRGRKSRGPSEIEVWDANENCPQIFNKCCSDFTKTRHFKQKKISFFFRCGDIIIVPSPNPSPMDSTSPQPSLLCIRLCVPQSSSEIDADWYRITTGNGLHEPWQVACSGWRSEFIFLWRWCKSGYICTKRNVLRKIVTLTSTETVKY